VAFPVSGISSNPIALAVSENGVRALKTSFTDPPGSSALPFTLAKAAHPLPT
jgi:hypothetical protein